MARAKCKRGTKLTERVRLLSPAAEALLLQGGKKSSPLLRQVVEATTCTTTKGDRVVTKAVIKKGNLRGASREVVGARGGFAPPPRAEIHRPDLVHQVTDEDIVPDAAPSYDAWTPGTWPRSAPVHAMPAASRARPGGANWAPSGQGSLFGAEKRFYVHYGDAQHRPMSTESFSSKSAALAAVKRSNREGFPARLG